MKLLGDFYTIKQASGGEGAGFEYIISLNKEHFIFKAHFPGSPIMPGVCVIQICKELLEQRIGETLFLQKILNVKFLSAINPTVVTTIQVSFSKMSVTEEGYKFSALIHWDNTQFAKLCLYLQHQY
jgi:3-hydroxyacyl-[acyl-carrier-protein] dehydratase